MAEGHLTLGARVVVAVENADVLPRRYRLARGGGEREDGVGNHGVVKAPVVDFLPLLGRIIDEVLERGRPERCEIRDSRAVVEIPLLAPSGPCRVLDVARAPLVPFVPFARASAGKNVCADTRAPLLLGVCDEVKHPFLRGLDPSRIARGVGYLREGVYRKPAYRPVWRVEVDHADELGVRARLEEVLDLRVERRPVVLLDPLPNERIVAVRHPVRIDGVRGEEDAQRYPHVRKILRALELLAETPVADVLRTRIGGLCAGCGGS